MFQGTLLTTGEHRRKQYISVPLQHKLQLNLSHESEVCQSNTSELLVVNVQ